MNAPSSCEVIAWPNHFEPPQNEGPKHEHPQNERGPLTNFFPLSHDLFSHPQIQALSGDAFRVFLWLNAKAWQFPTSNGHIQASTGRLSRAMGLSEANVSRTLSTLRQQGLIRLVRNDFKYGNIWEVQNLAKARTKEPAQLPQDERTATSKRASSPLKMSGDPSQFEGQVISKNSKETEESLSPTGASEFLKAYVTGLKPQKKRESENRNLKLLLEDYSQHEIELALKHLLESGLPGSGEKCHSPMSYLAQAMGQVLAEAQAQNEKSAKIALQREALREAEAKRLAEEDRDAEAAVVREAAFCKAFPTREQQEAWIKTFAQGHPVLRGCGPALRGLAIQSWYSNHTSPTKG